MNNLYNSGRHNYNFYDCESQIRNPKIIYDILINYLNTFFWWRNMYSSSVGSRQQEGSLKSRHFLA